MYSYTEKQFHYLYKSKLKLINSARNKTSVKIVMMSKYIFELFNNTFNTDNNTN